MAGSVSSLLLGVKKVVNETLTGLDNLSTKQVSEQLNNVLSTLCDIESKYAEDGQQPHHDHDSTNFNWKSLSDLKSDEFDKLLQEITDSSNNNDNNDNTTNDNESVNISNTSKIDITNSYYNDEEKEVTTPTSKSRSHTFYVKKSIVNHERHRTRMKRIDSVWKDFFPRVLSVAPQKILNEKDEKDEQEKQKESEKFLNPMRQGTTVWDHERFAIMQLCQEFPNINEKIVKRMYVTLH